MFARSPSIRHPWWGEGLATQLWWGGGASNVAMVGGKGENEAVVGGGIENGVIVRRPNGLRAMRAKKRARIGDGIDVCT